MDVAPQPRAVGPSGHRAAPRRVSVRLTVATDGGQRDVEIDAPESATVGAVAQALADHVGTDSTGVLYCPRIGALAPAMPMRDSGLREGDVVALHPGLSAPDPTVTRGGAPCELVVVAGPASGSRFPLAPGTHIVGRDPEHADIAIDDPSVSRRHLRVEIGAEGRATVVDAGSSNGTAIEGIRLRDGEACTVTPEEHIEAGRTLLCVRPLRLADPTSTHSGGTRVAHNRPPRVSRAYELATLRMSPPPPASRLTQIPLATAIIPLAMGVTLYAVTGSPMMLLMAVFSPVMMLSTVITNRRSGRKEHARALAGFRAQLEELGRALADAHRAELRERRLAAPDAAELVARARRHLPELWERRPADADFMDVRVGVADQPSTTSVVFPDGGDPDERARVEDLVRRYATAPSVPIRVRLTDVGAIGLAGEEEPVEALARWLVVQVAVLHSPRDVVIVAALSSRRADRWRWLGWLPHTASPSSPFDGPQIAVGDGDGRDLIRRLVQLSDDRRAEQESRSRARRRTAVLLLADEDVDVERSHVDRLLDRCADVDMAAIWMARERRTLPGGCGAVVETGSARATADVVWAETGRRIDDAAVDRLSVELAEAAARGLTPVVDVSAAGAAAALPRYATLVEILDLVEPQPDDILARWRSGSAGAGLRAVLGAAAGRAFSIDLRADGPHALVAGTTGAGKSELLQTLVVSLAAEHRPDRLTFLLIDYKGGSAFKDCVRLPHAVGLVTDLNQHEVGRALISLNAELRRREHVLAKAGARDLLELERRHPDQAPPSLVIVIDEFATLAKEVPAFVDGVVDVAQRGRSLGVHLILATQRPGNAITDSIRANTNVRIALRVATPVESEDIISAPDAGRLPRYIPGRAYARTGPSELTPFQTAHVGGRTARLAEGAGIEVHELHFGARVERDGATDSASSPDDDAKTDLDLLVDAIAGAAAELELERPAPPWLPPLTDEIPLEPAESDDGQAVFGVIDEPTRQRQVPLVVDFTETGNLLVYGTGGAGKTTTLRSVAAAMALAASPRELHVYGLDFAGRGLAGLQALPHCGSIVAGEDEERVDRLIAFLRRTIDERARRFARAGVSTVAEYRRAVPSDPAARILVLLDSYAGFVDFYDKVDLGALVEAVPRLVADGRAAGVHFVITADRRSAVPTAISSVVPARIVLRMASDDEYSALGLDRRAIMGAVLPAGRGWLSDGRATQVAVLGGSTDPAVQAKALADLAVRLSAEHAGAPRVPPIEPVPTDVARSHLPSSRQPWRAVVGLETVQLSPLELSAEDAHVAVIGPYRSGRTTALGTLASSLRDATAGLRSHLLAPRRSALTEEPGWRRVARGIEACEEEAHTLLEELLATGEDDATPVLVVIDDAGLLAESAAASALEQLLRRGRDRELRVLAALETGEARHYAAWIRELRKDGNGVLLNPNPDVDGDLLGVRLPRRARSAHPPGRGYAVVNGAAIPVQVAR